MKYKVGDKVIIRQWDDMVKEFGMLLGGYIGCILVFSNRMRRYCGEIIEITGIESGVYFAAGNRYSWVDEMIERKADMTKSDLKSGMVVETRNGNRYLAISESNGLCLMNLSGYSYCDMEYMAEDMTHPKWCSHCDIMRVFEPQVTLDKCKTTNDVIWEREKPKEMTIGEIEKILGHSVKIVKEDESCS